MDIMFAIQAELLIRLSLVAIGHCAPCGQKMTMAGFEQH